MICNASTAMLGYEFPFIYISFYIIFPFTYIHPLWNPQNTSEQFRDLSKNDTTNILNSYILLKNSLSQSEATELSGTVASLSFNSSSESENTLFGMHSQHILMATWLLAWDQRLWAAKNNFLWAVSTHRKSYEVLGLFGNPCESSKGLSNDLQWSLAFTLFPYNLCINTRCCLHQ